MTMLEVPRTLRPMLNIMAGAALLPVGVETRIPPVLVPTRVRDPLVEAQKLAYLSMHLILLPPIYGTPPVLPLVQIPHLPLLMTTELLAVPMLIGALLLRWKALRASLHPSRQVRAVGAARLPTVVILTLLVRLL